jgi:hypothetical protein
MIHENPRREVKARPAIFLIRERGSKRAPVMAIILEVLPFHWSGNPA